MMMRALPILLLTLVVHHCGGSLNKEDEERILIMIRDPSNVNETTIREDILKILGSMDLKEAFLKTTGYKLETVLIIIVLVMTIPGLIINILFMICTIAIKQGGKKAVCCCMKCGTAAICCPCRQICGCK